MARALPPSAHAKMMPARRIPLVAGGRSHPDTQFGGFLGCELEHHRRSSTSRGGSLLDGLPYRSRAEMYSALSVAMSGSDH